MHGYVAGGTSYIISWANQGSAYIFTHFYFLRSEEGSFLVKGQVKT